MITIRQNSVNKIIVQSNGGDYLYLLLVFTNSFTCVQRFVLCTIENYGCTDYEFEVQEMNGATANQLEGQVNLIVGGWDLSIYGVNQITLDSALGTLIETDTVNVLGDVCVTYPDADEPTNCPEIVVIDGGSLALGDSQFTAINGLLDGGNL